MRPVFAGVLLLGWMFAACPCSAVEVNQPGYTSWFFSKASGSNNLDIDSSGTFYLSYGSSGISKVTAAGDSTRWSRAIAADFTLDPAGGGYAAGSGLCKCIEEIRPDGSFTTIRQDTLEWTSVALTQNGTLYAALWAGPGKGLYRIDRTTGQPTAIVLGGPGPGGYGNYWSLIGGADGKLYVTGTVDGSLTGSRLLRLDGSILTSVAVLPHGGRSLTPGPDGTFFVIGGHDYGSGYPRSEVWSVDPANGDTLKLASSGSYFHNWNPQFQSLGYDARDQTLYVQESGVGTWAIQKIPTSIVTWGEGSAFHVDTTLVEVQWPVQVHVKYLVDIYLERRTENGTFGMIQLNRASDGNVSFADQSVVPGTRYAYRAGARAASGFEYSGEIWVDVPPLTPPPPPIQVWTGGAATVDSSSVTLDWTINPVITGDVRIERRTVPGVYGSIGVVHLAGDGRVHLVDEAVVRGASYVYRAGVLSDTGWVWSEELAATIPTVAPPATPIWSAGSVQADTSSVTLDWPIDPVISGDARIERRLPPGDFASLTAVHLVGDGHVRFIDRSVTQGTSYVYRAGIPSNQGWIWSGELSAEVPVSSPPPPPPPPAGDYSFAFARGTSLVVGTISAEFSTPAAGTIRIEAFDLTGRRVASATIQVERAGTYRAELSSSTSFKPGIYFLRMTQGTSRALSRAIVVASV